MKRGEADGKMAPRPRHGGRVFLGAKSPCFSRTRDSGAPPIAPRDRRRLGSAVSRVPLTGSHAGGAVEPAIKYAKSANDFGEHVEKLLPRLTAIASWVGAAGRGLLAMVGVAI